MTKRFDSNRTVEAKSEAIHRRSIRTAHKLAGFRA